MRFIVLAEVALFAAAASAQPVPKAQPVVIEHYYRIKWGSLGEFKTLYARNHAPLLAAMRERGLITDVVTHEPVQHMAGVQLAAMSASNAASTLSPALLPLMASVLAPWSLSRIRHT